MTSTNHIHIGNGKTIQELLPSQLHEMQYNKPTESKRFMIIKTQAERVGGGYILSQYEKPIPENPENVAFLQAAIHLATKSQNEMIERFNALYHSNMNLYDLVYNKLDKECYESGLLEQQKNALQIQKLEQNQLENELNSKKFRLAELKSSSENTIQKLVDSMGGGFEK